MTTNVQDTRTEVRVVMTEQPFYAPKFLDMMSEVGYDALREHLKKLNETTAMTLLDVLQDIQVIGPTPNNDMSRESLIEDMAELSRLIVELDGKYLTPSGSVVNYSARKPKDVEA